MNLGKLWTIAWILALIYLYVQQKLIVFNYQYFISNSYIFMQQKYFKQILIFEANKSVVSMFHTPMKHAKISQSESLLEWYK